MKPGISIEVEIARLFCDCNMLIAIGILGDHFCAGVDKTPNNLSNTAGKLA